jgi:hypothetical protein
VIDYVSTGVIGLDCTTSVYSTGSLLDEAFPEATTVVKSQLINVLQTLKENTEYVTLGDALTPSGILDTVANTTDILYDVLDDLMLNDNSIVSTQLIHLFPVVIMEGFETCAGFLDPLSFGVYLTFFFCFLG